jgi:hypothetical protein
MLNTSPRERRRPRPLGFDQLVFKERGRMRSLGYSVNRKISFLAFVKMRTSNIDTSDEITTIE